MIWVLNNQLCTPNRLTEIIFQAEVDHLNQHTRPITGANYYKGNQIFCLEIEKLYAELNPLLKPLPVTNTRHLSISDVNCLKNCLLTILDTTPYIQSLSFNDLINYQEMIFNQDILEYLKENDLFNIVI